MNKRILISLSVISIVSAIAIGGTIAYFSDTETSAGNTFTAGTLDFKVDSNCSYNGQPQSFCTWDLKDLSSEKFFDYGDLKPGDEGENTFSLHIDGNDSWACMKIEPKKNDDMTCTEPETGDDPGCNEPDDDLWDGDLAQNFYGGLWVDMCDDPDKDPGVLPNPGDNIYQPECELFPGGDEPGPAPLETQIIPLADKNFNLFNWPQNGEPLKAGKDYYLGLRWFIPTTTNNVIQSDSCVLDISFYGEQYQNNPDFSCGPLP